jgi:hypothetical protein
MADIIKVEHLSYVYNPGMPNAVTALDDVSFTVSLPAGGVATVGCIQRTKRTVSHEVSAPTGFYSIQVPDGVAGAQLTAIQVTKDDGATSFAYSPDWCNVLPGDLTYQVETDERRRLWLRFGATGVVGYGVSSGDVFEVLVSECEGRIDDLSPGTEFSFEYIFTVEDGSVKSVLSSVVDAGADHLSIEVLRMMAKYPAIYDHNAVYLGEFDFLLRRYISPLNFLSVWNEQIEESVRGPSVSNINKVNSVVVVDGRVFGHHAQVFNRKMICPGIHHRRKHGFDATVLYGEDVLKAKLSPRRQVINAPLALGNQHLKHISAGNTIAHHPCGTEAQPKPAPLIRFDLVCQVTWQHIAPVRAVCKRCCSIIFCHLNGRQLGTGDTIWHLNRIKASRG